MLIVKLLKLICGLYNWTLAKPLVSRDAGTLTVVSGGKIMESTFCFTGVGFSVCRLPRHR